MLPVEPQYSKWRNVVRDSRHSVVRRYISGKYFGQIECVNYTHTCITLKAWSYNPLGIGRVQGSEDPQPGRRGLYSSWHRTWSVVTRPSQIEWSIYEVRDLLLREMLTKTVISCFLNVEKIWNSAHINLSSTPNFYRRFFFDATISIEQSTSEINADLAQNDM